MKLSILSFLLSDMPNGYWLYIWTKQGRTSQTKWFDKVDEAVKFAESIGKKADTYFGIGVTKQKPKVKIRKNPKDGTERKVAPSQQRLESSEVDGLSCIWIDIDYADAVHRKQNLPPNEESALSLITSMPLKASAIIHSGHGYQAYWLLDAFYVIDSDKKRETISRISQGWQRKIQNLALEKGWEVDSTFDLSRIYRVNGTMNFKDEPKPVLLLSTDSKARYSVKDFEPHIEKEVKIIKEKTETKVDVKLNGHLTLDKDADVPKVKFDALMENNLKFKQSWNHKRRDMRDTSMSAYDLSLATIAAYVGWKDQEIVNLLISHRRKYGSDLKLRDDYYTNTIARAKDVTVKEQRVGEAVRAEISNDTTENLANISNAFGIRVTRIEKYLSEPVQYVISFENGRQLELRGSSELMSQNIIRTKMADVLDFRLENFKAAEWNSLVDKILASTEKVEVGSDSTQMGLVAHYLYEYLDRYIVEDDDQAERALRQRPVVIGEDYCFTFDDFIKFIDSEFKENFKRSELMQKLTRLGCTGKSKTIKDPHSGRITSKYFWVIRKSFMVDHRRVLGIEITIEPNKDA